MCGEQANRRNSRTKGMGSPPRVRGTESGAGMTGQGNRITPACAGNSGLIAAGMAYLEDHPRVCGEQCLISLELNIIKGSPPRVRGTEHHGCNAFHSIRITPACAGNRSASPEVIKLNRDHPRVCGEQLASQPDSNPAKGSPPRVRGTEAVAEIDVDGTRITPACAGNRQRYDCFCPCFQDHPRVCGEQLILF